MSFSDDEIAYLRSQRLGRIATVAPDGQPDAIPVGFEFDGSHFYVGGHGETERTRKFRNVREGNPRVALVIDDLASTEPWSPRGMRIYGTAEFVERAGLRRPDLPAHHANRVVELESGRAALYRSGRKAQTSGTRRLAVLGRGTLPGCGT